MRSQGFSWHSTITKRIHNGKGCLAPGSDNLGQVVKPYPLEGNPPSGNEGNGSKPQGEGLFSLISKGQVEEDGVRPIVIVSGKENFLQFGEGDF